MMLYNIFLFMWLIGFSLVFKSIILYWDIIILLLIDLEIILVKLIFCKLIWEVDFLKKYLVW